MNEHCHTKVNFVIYYYYYLFKYFFYSSFFTHLLDKYTHSPKIPAGFKTHTCVYTGQTTIHNNSNITQTMFTLLDFYTLPGGSMS